MEAADPNPSPSELKHAKIALVVIAALLLFVFGYSAFRQPPPCGEASGSSQEPCEAPDFDGQEAWEEQKARGAEKAAGPERVLEPRRFEAPVQVHVR